MIPQGHQGNRTDPPAPKPAARGWGLAPLTSCPSPATSSEVPSQGAPAHSQRPGLALAMGPIGWTADRDLPEGLMCTQPLPSAHTGPRAARGPQPHQYQGGSSRCWLTREEPRSLNFPKCKTGQCFPARLLSATPSAQVCPALGVSCHLAWPPPRCDWAHMAHPPLGGRGAPKPSSTGGQTLLPLRPALPVSGSLPSAATFSQRSNFPEKLISCW